MNSLTILADEPDDATAMVWNEAETQAELEGNEKAIYRLELNDKEILLEDIEELIAYNKTHKVKDLRLDKNEFFDDYAHHPTEIKEVLNGVKKVYSNYEKICIFQPHRISRLKDLKSEFASAFKDADKVILFPIYTAGEKIKLGFSYYNFAKEIIKKSKVELFLVNDKYQLAKYIKHNIYGDKIVIGMGAGSISSWMREMPKFL